ncbi:MAG TPA: AAA family ATPase [Candidatus Babeliales bacterium]|nr:AAA family ATPase [Candidatus Babeliales bacterium]
MILIITGQQGSGKTLLAVREMLAYAHKGYKIVSNVKLKGIKHDNLDYDKVTACEYERCVIFMDEVHQILPARRSMSKSSIAIVDGFLSMIRKKEVILIATTQFERKVDNRLRLEKDYIIACRRYAYMNNGFVPVPPDFKDASVVCIIEAEMTCIFNSDSKKMSFVANKYYKYYDTHQLIIVNKK